MRIGLWFLFFGLFSASIVASTIRGTVRAPGGAAIAGAAVMVDGGAPVLTAADGAFSIEASDGDHALLVRHSGFQRWSRTVQAGVVVDVELKPEVADTIVVSGIRAADATPVTKSTVDRTDIERDYHEQDIPLLLRDVPSITSYAEAGTAGAGYSYMALRGVSSSRINFTLDGVPLADGEDMTTYFADFPDLARSLESIQVQRGVGTSTFGSASFGGSVNMQSIDLAAAREVDATIAGGSFGTRFGTVGFQSGMSPQGLAIYARLSLNETDGFRDHSGGEQHNLFASAAKESERSLLKATGFSARERQQMSYLAADADTLRTDLRNNPLGPDDRDSFGYELANLQYIRMLSPSMNVTASAYYQRGYGWYSLEGPTPDVRNRYGLDGKLAGSLVTMSVARGAWTTQLGLSADTFRRDHTLDDVAESGGSLLDREYHNYGVKTEANAFARTTFDRGRWHLYGDGQLRTAHFDYHGSVTIAPIRWTFFNPKVGARFALTSSTSAYASAGESGREPARNDLFQGEDDATIPHDLHAVRPEHVRDFEAGWEWHPSHGSVKLDGYAMEFRDEIEATGELSDIGLPLRRNVDRSFRHGIELEARWDATSRIQLRTSADISRNRIADWTQSYDIYDDAGNFIGSDVLTHHNVQPLLTPEVVVSQSLDFRASARWSASLTGRYVSASYLDNTSNRAFRTPALTSADAVVRWAAWRGSRISLAIDNITSARLFASGYSYLTMTPDREIGGIAYFYPQATRSFTLMFESKL